MQDLLWLVGRVFISTTTYTHPPNNKKTARPVVVGRPGQTRRPTRPRRLLSRARGASCALLLVMKMVIIVVRMVCIAPGNEDGDFCDCCDYCDHT